MSEQTHSALEHFPITFFTTVMGMSGLTLALHAGERALGLTNVTSSVALAATVALFVVVALTYAAKALRYPAAVAAEWNHPVKLAFFPAVSISLLLMATAMLGRFPGVAQGMWLVGMLLQGVLTVLVVTGWISTRSFVHGHLSPAWFIPAVGNVIVPIAGAQMGYVEISWYFMSIGLIFWVVLLTLVMNRLIFHDPLPGRLQPTLVILIAPPAVGFLAWLRLNGGVIDPFAHILLNAAYFFALLVAVQLPRILRLPFAMSFWALSFPVAALTIASFVHAGVAKSGFHQMLGMALLAALIVIIAALIIRTSRAVIAGAVFQPE
ncbi:SLAC1 anion channel family protein [Roseovarius sp. PS-C2]|uniref:SLAC1 anion channel family protein n=1 Tax=Roseovarius sp. PS-C2 TaxID=2820814 RepID=UPI001C0DDC28|nr:SLAC1 anion channel family protein [Roseovarius sp. PS-C2]MBU3261641.1 SLAC1 anion channel family protein [Roseovarius sp. PS-C2]